MAGHTPGPWEYENVQQRRDQSAYGVVKSADGKMLFDTLNSDVGEIHTEADGEGGVYRWDETGKRNLTLAAAAPDLLTACERVLNGPTALDPDVHAEILAAVRAAVVKAKGK